MYQRRSGNSRVTEWCQTDISVSVSVSIRNGTPEHIVESVVLRPSDLLLPSSRIRKFIVTDIQGGKGGHLRNPTLSSPLHDSNPCLVNCTAAHLLHVVSTFVACALRQRAR